MKLLRRVGRPGKGPRNGRRFTGRVQPTDRLFTGEGRLDAEIVVAESAVAATTRSAGRGRRLRRAKKLVGIAERTVLSLARLNERVSAYLSDPLKIKQREAVNAEITSRYQYGRVLSWLSLGLVTLLTVPFIVNDGTFIATTARVKLDVPTSVGTWDLSNLSNLFALGMATVLTVVLFAATMVGGRTLAWWLAAGRRGGSPALTTGEVNPATELAAFIPKRSYMFGSLLVVGGMCMAMHYLAESRFSGGLFQQAGASSSELFGWVITLLPVAMLMAATVAENPRFRQHRSFMIHSFWLRLFEWRVVRRESCLVRRYRRRYVRSETACAALQDVLDFVTLTADTLYAQLAVQDQSIKLNGAERPGALPPTSDRKITYTGHPESRFLPSIPHAGRVVQAVMHRFAALPAPVAASSLRNQFSTFRAWPAEFEVPTPGPKQNETHRGPAGHDENVWPLWPEPNDRSA